MLASQLRDRETFLIDRERRVLLGELTFQFNRADDVVRRQQPADEQAACRIGWHVQIDLQTLTVLIDDGIGDQDGSNRDILSQGSRETARQQPARRVSFDHRLRGAAGSRETHSGFDDGDPNAIVKTATENEVAPRVLLHLLAAVQKRTQFDGQRADDSDLGMCEVGGSGV